MQFSVTTWGIDALVSQSNFELSLQRIGQMTKAIRATMASWKLHIIFYDKVLGSRYMADMVY
jgi:hypothetical protein|tara:strand:+ start:1417 stop:1602 length:186 start_codon:yes stop_codon:yes gene_type:complete